MLSNSTLLLPIIYHNMIKHIILSHIFFFSLLNRLVFAMSLSLVPSFDTTRHDTTLIYSSRRNHRLGRQFSLFFVSVHRSFSSSSCCLACFIFNTVPLPQSLPKFLQWGQLISALGRGGDKGTCSDALLVEQTGGDVRDIQMSPNPHSRVQKEDNVQNRINEETPVAIVLWYGSVLLTRLQTVRQAREDGQQSASCILWSCQSSRWCFGVCTHLWICAFPS